ncbi:MAG: hypothetical protein RLZZ57_2328 [Pseudomonadota bacterium]|jgi:hypothetical protein|nr:hypothetical protein [Acetobacteraceae bacterium]NBS43233.1 hypothetical protein [Acetobacteraceae bacterium]
MMHFIRHGMRQQKNARCGDLMRLRGGANSKNQSGIIAAYGGVTAENCRAMSEFLATSIHGEWFL